MSKWAQPCWGQTAGGCWCEHSPAGDRQQEGADVSTGAVLSGLPSAARPWEKMLCRSPLAPLVMCHHWGLHRTGLGLVFAKVAGSTAFPGTKSSTTNRTGDNDNSDHNQHVNPEACALSHCTVSASLGLSTYARATLHFRISFYIQFPFEYLEI